MLRSPCATTERANVLTAVTDQDGLYRFSLLPPGEYELTVETAGFAPLVVREVMIQITEVRRIAASLRSKAPEKKS